MKSRNEAKSMGTFKIDIEVAGLEKPMEWKRFQGVLVDTGADATWLPERELTRLGIKIFKKDERFMMANGQVITRDIGIALIRSGPFKTVDEVIFAKPGDLPILGARALEGFHAMVDPRHKKLVSSGPAPAAVTAA